MRLLFKFVDETQPGDRRRVIGLCRSYGDLEVRRLFPDESEDDLAATYFADVENGSTGQRVTVWLKGLSEIEYATVEPIREAL
jgi:hypothetical protein